ncbi:Cof-type HAD-IIB family hydrolase [Gordoniibacillus kamchatkensis]|uniref:Cof-type HAD-IIB family hydrolase n=1 Tax=Gordoniibacillus kamchatkensis TaxID=1590651 RepID=UPI0018CD4076|nr:Cof-type HAD-IIB family hydrolase [Paenibacillus sp. VKM B-2647]
MKKTLIVTDMDGTLLDRFQSVSLENLAAIRRFKADGGLFTLATGRMEAAVLPYISQLEIDLPVILYNGAKIYSPVTGTVIYEKHVTVPQPLWKRFTGWLSGDTALLVYRQGGVYAPLRNGVLELHERKEGVRCGQMRDEWIDEPITKILFIGPRQQLESVEAIIADSGLRCETVYSDADYLELLPAGASKGAALRELQRLLQIDGLYTVALGDNMNDVSMLQEADLGIAVENAAERLKEVADAVTVHHEKHALAAVIREIAGRQSADGR